MNEEQSGELIGKAARLVMDSRRVMLFSGAGIGTESGLPDFRGPDGIWKKLDPENFTIGRFIKDENVRKRLWDLFKDFAAEIKPNAAHYAAAELYGLGKLDCVVTQNVDGLHQKAGLPDECVFELHGNMSSLVCIGCRQPVSMEDARAFYVDSEEMPCCRECGGILKPGAVFFGEQLPAGVFEAAKRRAGESDLCLVVGSTLTVYPAALIPEYAVDSGVKLVIINTGSTQLDGRAEIVIRAKAGETMAHLVDSVKTIAAGRSSEGG